MSKVLHLFDVQLLRILQSKEQGYQFSMFLIHHCIFCITCSEKMLSLCVFTCLIHNTVMELHDDKSFLQRY